MNDLLEQKPNKLTFNQRATPIPPELRPIWRISLIALILWKVSRSNKASVKKIQALNNIIISDKKRLIFDGKLKRQETDALLDIRYDPAINRAIEIGRAENLFLFDDRKNVQLTDKGINFAKTILSNEESLTVEKDFLSSYSKSELSEKIITKLIAVD